MGEEIFTEEVDDDTFTTLIVEASGVVVEIVIAGISVSTARSAGRRILADGINVEDRKMKRRRRRVNEAW